MAIDKETKPEFVLVNYIFDENALLADEKVRNRRPN